MSQKEYTGGSVSYYTVRVERPTSADASPYSAECNDIIEALGMNYAEGNAFKALWRRCAARNLGLAKHGYKDGRYDAEKVVFFGQRLVAQEPDCRQGAALQCAEKSGIPNFPRRLAEGADVAFPTERGLYFAPVAAEDDGA